MEKNENFYADYFRTIVKNKIQHFSAFLETYIPKLLIHREDYVTKIMDWLVNYDVVLTGVPSTGKTAIIKKLFNSIKNITQFKCIYVNCKNWQRNDVLYQISFQMSGKQFKYKTISPMTFYNNIENCRLKFNYEKVFICLDEYDILANKLKSVDDILYWFADNPYYTLIIVANTADWLSETVDERTRSRMAIKHLEMPRYVQTECYDILKARLREGMGNDNNLLSEKELQNLAKISVSEEDSIRKGIRTLSVIIKHKLNNIERKSDLTYSEIKSMFKDEYHINKAKQIGKLADKHKFIITILYQIKKDNKIGNYIKEATQKIILLYWKNNCNQNGLPEITERTLRTYLKYLKEFEFIEETAIRDGGMGTPEKAYRTTFDIELIKLVEGEEL